MHEAHGCLRTYKITGGGKGWKQGEASKGIARLQAGSPAVLCVAEHVLTVGRLNVACSIRDS